MCCRWECRTTSTRRSPKARRWSVSAPPFSARARQTDEGRIHRRRQHGRRTDRRHAAGRVQPSEIDVLEIDAARSAELTAASSSAARTSGPATGCKRARSSCSPSSRSRCAKLPPRFKPHLKRPLVLSIAAGVRAQTIGDWLATGKIVRAMPNMPALIRAGITAAIALPDVSAARKSGAPTRS